MYLKQKTPEGFAEREKPSKGKYYQLSDMRPKMAWRPTVHRTPAGQPVNQPCTAISLPVGRQAHFRQFCSAPFARGSARLLGPMRKFGGGDGGGSRDGASGGKSHLGHEEPLICSAQLTLGV